MAPKGSKSSFHGRGPPLATLILNRYFEARRSMRSRVLTLTAEA
jgi:hypothetical protein